MKIVDLLRLEQEHRKAGKWLIFSGEIVNDHGVTVKVQLKSYGFYNQIFRLNDDPVNYCSGHTISKVADMKKFITDTINKTPA